MALFLALTLLAQLDPVQQQPRVESAPKFSDGIDHVGVYLPNSQLLSWCTSKEGWELLACDRFIDGVVETAGMIDVDFPDGLIDTMTVSISGDRSVLRKLVISYIDTLPKIAMAKSAARSVYAAVVSNYPYSGSHRLEIPFRTTSGPAKGSKATGNR